MNRYDLLRLSTALSLVLAAACGDDDTPEDGGLVDTGTDDGGGIDTGLDVGGEADTGGDSAVADTGADTAVADAGTDTEPASIVTVTVNNNGASDYNFTMEDPESDVIGEGAGDQTITLVLDQRYSFVIVNSGPHPFEFITDNGAGPADDTVILSQDGDGTLEGDATIAWDESVAGTITFTASASFMSAVDAYRCAVHRAMMRGEVAF